ncbi:myosin-10-like [Chenopodium quinoa]|uniref:myosin-10-like n=1 Tax=Chenopodium quinoa TaxID=63459 RepID=UPI000B794E93|nr:myosin-10-like [Chenopodium quinoa]
MVDAEKTSARSATQIRKTQLEKKKAQLAAKNDGAMLRVDGLKTPFNKRQEEVRDANKRATEALNSAQYRSTLNDIKSKAKEIKQEEIIKELTTALERSNKKTSDLELELKNAQSELKALEAARSENTELREDVGRLKDEITRMQSEYKTELESEQERLVDENEKDCEERMKIAWNLIHPDFDWDYFGLRYNRTSMPLRNMMPRP